MKNCVAKILFLLPICVQIETVRISIASFFFPMLNLGFIGELSYESRNFLNNVE